MPISKRFEIIFVRSALVARAVFRPLLFAFLHERIDSREWFKLSYYNLRIYFVGSGFFFRQVNNGRKIILGCQSSKIYTMTKMLLNTDEKQSMEGIRPVLLHL